MSSSYKHEEATDKVKPWEPIKTIILQIHCKNKKLRHIFIKNSVQKREDFSVVYQYKCIKVACMETKPTNIGRTTITMKERMKQLTVINYYRKTNALKYDCASQA